MSFTRQNRRAVVALVSLVAALTLVASGTPAGEPQTVKAFAVIEASGNVLPIGSDATRVMGTLEGPFFIESGHGPIDAGNLQCVANMQANLGSGRQSGEGSCVLTAHDDVKLFANWTCEGIRFIGCRGMLTITGGTGRLEGVSGGGQMTSRVSEFAEQPAGQTGLASTTSRGIVFWDEFMFRTP